MKRVQYDLCSIDIAQLCNGYRSNAYSIDAANSFS